jgi:Rrf2 family transcriptional regulator, nitric oxide-sensitive transcriptional repressor
VCRLKWTQPESRMKLTKYTDYALRVLLHLGEQPEALSSISQIATAHKISRNHLMKIVRHLGQSGILETTRGRTGGIRLALSPDKINVGKVVRLCEGKIQPADCTHCVLSPACSLTHVLDRATQAFFAVLDGATLADLLEKPQAI